MKASTGIKKSFLLRLEEKVLDQLRAAAEEKDMPLSQLLRDVLQDYLDGVPIPKPVKKLKEKKDQWWM